MALVLSTVKGGGGLVLKRVPIVDQNRLACYTLSTVSGSWWENRTVHVLYEDQNELENTSQDFS